MIPPHIHDRQVHDRQRADLRPRPEDRVPPTETPPGEDSMSGAGPRETYNPVRGWSAVPLALVIVITAMFVVFFLSYAVLLL